MIKIEELKPNEKEREALSLFYDRFYDLYEEVVNDDFINKDAKIRFYKLRESFSIYKELLSYEPIKEYINWMKKGGRPHFEGIIADDLFSFIRNLLLHFPIFDIWDEVYINKKLATWSKEGQIDKFLTKGIKQKIDGKGTVKYRIWEERKKKMTYFCINFPEKYNDTNIYLKDIISEEVGMKFCMALMRSILDTQVENAEVPDIKIMSQAYLPYKIDRI
ncbi:hypothetical protein [Clostridium beijerinckii]|uniref:hypothetical protein n=1 Tax=Clostridium beijerinckii TaxID=1520 RepID=UPI001A9AC757|nr:hypothetical protein [Clostridium beijerinckii]NRT72069.1 hypothetical protein [Clostridium beijerinckii]